MMSSPNFPLKSMCVIVIALLANVDRVALGQCEVSKLFSSDAALDDNFGNFVCGDGEVAVIGAPGDNDNGYSSGSAYVFRCDGTTWLKETKLVAGAGATIDRFGTSLSISGATIIVSATLDDDPGEDTGSVYVFRFDGMAWTEEARLLPTDRLPEVWYPSNVRSEDSNQNVLPDQGGSLVGLDIQPGLCPNSLNPGTRGVLPVAIIGSESFDVADVDLRSLRLSRADGFGGLVAPLSASPLAGSQGPNVQSEDVAAPFDGKLCECHDSTGDGVKDLVLQFSTSELIDRLKLNAQYRASEFVLTLDGVLLDGTVFEVSDCIFIDHQDLPPTLKRGKRGR